MNNAPQYHPSFAETTYTSELTDDAHSLPSLPDEFPKPQSWPTNPSIQAHLIDPNLSALPTSSNPYPTHLNESATYPNEGQAPKTYGGQVLGEEQEEYYGPSLPAILTHTINEDRPFVWNQRPPLNHCPVNGPSLYEKGSNASAGVGTRFSQDNQAPKQAVDDADLGNLDPDAVPSQHLQTTTLLFRRSEDYSYLRPFDENGVAKDDIIPGPSSSDKSRSSDKTSKNPKGLRKHHCDVCPGNFKYPKDLERHKPTHDSRRERPFKCTVENCQKEFFRRDHLLRHFRQIHPGTVPPFKSGVSRARLYVGAVKE